MTSRSDIIDGIHAIGRKYGLICTKKCGWIDLGHANPDGPDGARNLREKILNEKDERGAKTGYFRIKYKQAMGNRHMKIGIQKKYDIKKGISEDNKKSVFLIAALIVVTSAYATFICFSDRREYSGFSLDYFLLTPEVLSKLAKECQDSPAFIYSSADGPKPTIVTLNCTIPMNKLEEKMRSDGFHSVNGLYQKEGAQIQIASDVADKVVTSVVYIDNI